MNSRRKGTKLFDERFIPRTAYEDHSASTDLTRERHGSGNLVTGLWVRGSVKPRPNVAQKITALDLSGLSGVLRKPDPTRAEDARITDGSTSNKQAPEKRTRRGRAIASRKRQLAEWDRSHPGFSYDPELFDREIRPRPAGVKLAEIVAAMGCSKSSASDIRRGKSTPHVSTWPALAALAGVDLLASSS